MCIQQVKEKLRNEPDLIVRILEELGCHDIKYRDYEIRGAVPDGDNNTSVRVKLNENISCSIFSRDFGTGDIISLVQYYKKIPFQNALKWLCEFTNTEYSDMSSQTNETLKFLNTYKNIKKEKQVIQHDVLDEKILNKYKWQPIQEWVDEGVNIDTQKKFGIRYDEQGSRIIIPIRDEEGRLINIKARTTLPFYKEAGIPKYIHLFKMGVNDILFGLHFNKENIKQKKEVIIFEAEKSVMKADSMGICNTISIGSHNMGEYQVQKILQLHCDVVLAYDKDVKYKEIIKEVQKLSRFTNVYVVYDKEGLLGEKDAPVDKGKEVWERLYQNKMRVI